LTRLDKSSNFHQNISTPKKEFKMDLKNSNDSILKVQDIAVIDYCRAIVGIENDTPNEPNINQIYKYWNQIFPLDKNDLPIKFYDIYNKKSSRKFTPRSLNDLERGFTGVRDTYYYGPLGTCLWLALTHAENHNEPLYDLSKLIGIDPSFVENLEDEHLNVLAYYFPDCSNFVFTYCVHKFCKDTHLQNLDPKKLKLGYTSLDLMMTFHQIRLFLHGFSLDRSSLLQLICSDSWCCNKGKQSRDYPVTEFLEVTESRFGHSMPLGIYVENVIDSFSTEDVGDIFSDYFYEKYIKPITISYRKISRPWDNYGTAPFINTLL
jgi:hypothetical protein